MKGWRVFVVVFYLFFLLSFTLLCFQFYQYYLMLSLIAKMNPMLNDVVFFNSKN